MGLFGGGYTKEGPGVDKDAPKKRGIFLYAELFVRKFWKIIQSNLLYSMVSLPMLVLMFCTSFFMIMPAMEGTITAIAETVGYNTGELAVHFSIIFAFGMTTLWGSGPASAGLAYILRCFAREEHAWIWSDFKDKFKSNLKQSAVVIIVDLAVLFLVINAVYFYSAQFRSTGNTMWFVMTYIILLLFVLYTFMHFYIYQIMVTFECTIVQLYRNALIFAFAKLPMNLLLTAFILAVLLGLSSFLPQAAVVVLYLAVGINFSVFPTAFYASRSLQRVLESTLENKPNNAEKETD